MTSPTRKLPRRDFVAIISSLAVMTMLAWLYLFSLAANMSMPVVMAKLQIQQWDVQYFGMMFLMWAIMMMGMMIPSVAPAVLIYAAVAKKSAAQGIPAAPTGAFVGGYLVMWFIFCLFATAAQWGLDHAALLSPMMVSKSVALGAGLLISAGIYQFLPVKDRCLSHCRSPVEFISAYWRPGVMGAFKMGAHHGAYCLGCCWVLMGLLFVGGVMNLLWIAAITIFVLLEKVLPLGPSGSRLTGLAMIASGGIFSWLGA